MKYDELKKRIESLEFALRYVRDYQEALSIQFEINRLKENL